MLDGDFELQRDEFRNIWMNFQTVINLFFTFELVSDIYLQGLKNAYQKTFRVLVETISQIIFIYGLIYRILYPNDTE